MGLTLLDVILEPYGLTTQHIAFYSDQYQFVQILIKYSVCDICFHNLNSQTQSWNFYFQLIITVPH